LLKTPVRPVIRASLQRKPIPCISYSGCRMTLEEEKTLLEKIKINPRHFGVLFDHNPIFGYVFRRVVRYSLTQDIVAKAFLKAFLKIQDFEWKRIPVSAWLYRIATNEVNYYFRKQSTVR